MTSEYQEDGKTLKENYEKMSKKTSNGDGLVDVEERDRGVRMCWTQPHQDPTCLPQCHLWPLSALEKTASCDWRTIYLGEQAIYPWASLLISRTRRVGYTTQETDKCPKALAYIGRGGQWKE